MRKQKRDKKEKENNRKKKAQVESFVKKWGDLRSVGFFFIGQKVFKISETTFFFLSISLSLFVELFFFYILTFLIDSCIFSVQKVLEKLEGKRRRRRKGGMRQNSLYVYKIWQKYNDIVFCDVCSFCCFR